MQRGEPIICQSCGEQTPRRSFVQIYCPDCAGNRGQTRKNDWNRRHPRTSEQLAAREDRHWSRIRENGERLTEPSSVFWDAGEPIDLVWHSRFAVPFTYGMSKNRMLNKNGDMSLQVEWRNQRDTLRDHIALRMTRPDAPTVVQAKLWLDILVEKPDNRGDAVNVVDIVCDAVKVAIGLDDRWFSIRRLDWRIYKGIEPRLYVGFGQDTEIEQGACSSCGRILPLEQFQRNKRSKTGRGRNCKQCLAGPRSKEAAQEENGDDPTMKQETRSETFPFRIVDAAGNPVPVTGALRRRLLVAVGRARGRGATRLDR